jgi:hypothetical protein
VIALAEWALWREEPHYASGLPPRWYVPRVNLPPARPLDPVVSGYPEGRRDEAPTWIAPAELRREVLGDWPLAAGVADDEEPPAVVEGEVVEARIVESVEEDAWTIVEMPPAPLAQAEPAAEAPQPPGPALGPEPAPDVQAEPEREPEPEPELDVDLVRSAAGVARYNLDPLAEEPRRRFGRRREEVPTIEVPARPAGPRVLPGTSGEED